MASTFFDPSPKNPLSTPLHPLIFLWGFVQKSSPSTILPRHSFTIRLQNESRQQVCHQQHLRRRSCETSSSFACQRALQLTFWHFTIVVKFNYPSNHHRFWCLVTFSLFFGFGCPTRIYKTCFVSSFYFTMKMVHLSFPYRFTILCAYCIPYDPQGMRPTTY